MADLDKAKKNPRTLFWEELDDIRAGMLGVEGSGQHLQPMAPYGDPAQTSIWFFTDRDSDLLKVTGQSGRGVFTFQSEDRDFYACATGALRENTDRAKVDEYWNRIAAAWYEDGKDDPGLVLLQLNLETASIWASRGNALAFAWQIAKANITDDTPDVGQRNHFEFAG